MADMNSLLGPAARGGITWLSRKRLPKTQGLLNLAGIQAPVEILRDRWGIPHIYASNAHDLFFAQGFVQAQDRLWQMELNRRTARGQLSELFGELALDTDRTARTFGFERLGKADWSALDQEQQSIVFAFTEGVNAFLQQSSGRLPVEFTLLNHRPQPWEALDTLAFMRVMVWQLSHAWYGEIVRAQLIEKVGSERAGQLDVRYPSQNPATLPQGIEFNRLDADGVLKMVGGPFLDQGKGSNAWTVAGSRTATGKPFLCNDMHLAMTLPSVWYETHLSGGGYHMTGVTLPGVPMILVGHNDRIGWGMTLAFTDCEDLYVEQFDAQQPTRYQFGDQWLEAQVIPEQIRVKGKAEPHIENVVVTHHGPIISDVIGVPGQKLAVQSMALRPCPAYQGWIYLNQAKSWDDFVAAMRCIEAPQLNVAYADVDGNTGYWVTGKVPVRARGDGSLPTPGWSGDYEWVGEVPFEEMPHALNPQDGFLVTCNHRIVPDEYPHFLGNVWMNGYRARRIVDYFKSKDKLSFDDMRSMHMDFTCLPGKEFVATLEEFTSDDPDVKLALESLRLWDGKLDIGSRGGAVYEIARFNLACNLFEQRLGHELLMRWMGEGFHPLLYHSSEFYGHDTTTLLRLLQSPENLWIMEAGGKQALIEKSFKDAVTWLRKELGTDPAAWSWGQLHKITFAHSLALQKPLDAVFNRGPYPLGGDTDTPCQTAMRPGEPFECKAWAPSVRFFFDMGDLAQSKAMYAPGQSGQLGSPHYDDLIQPWLTGEYHPLLWTRAQVEQETTGLLTLVPAL